MLAKVDLFYIAYICAPSRTLSGHYQSTSEMPFEWRFAGGPMVTRFVMLTGLKMYSSEGV